MSVLTSDTVKVLRNGVWVNEPAPTGGSSPLTTKGDLYGYSTLAARVPIGTDGQVLTADSAQALGLKWATVSGTGDVTAASNLTDNAIVRGDGGAKGVQTSGIIIDDSNNVSGMGTLASGAHTITSASATALKVGDTTNPALLIDASTASAANGFTITPNVAGSNVTVQVTSGTTNEGADLRTKGTGSWFFRSGSTLRMTISSVAYTFAQSVNSTASTVRWSYTGAANTGLTAGAEFTQIYWNMGQINQHLSNTAITTQRDSRIDGMTHSFVTSGGVITDAYAQFITAPIAGTNATITNNWALGLSGSLQISGSLNNTGTRVTKGWFTDIESTNAPTVGGVVVPTIGSTNTLTNKRITKRVVSVAGPGATPTTNTDNCDIAAFTALAANITSMTTNLSGTPAAGDMIMFQFTDNGTPRTIAWGASFAATTVALPTTTVTSTLLRVGFQRNTANTAWDCIATA